MVVFQLAAGETQSFVSCQIRDFKYIFLKTELELLRLAVY